MIGSTIVQMETRTIDFPTFPEHFPLMTLKRHYTPLAEQKRGCRLAVAGELFLEASAPARLPLAAAL